MKFGFIAKHRGIWPVLWMCEALGVSRGGFYAWLTRPRSQRSRDDDELGAKVRASFLGSDRTYGARRVWRDLLTEGISCGLHRIERLMRLQALKRHRGGAHCLVLTSGHPCGHPMIKTETPIFRGICASSTVRELETVARAAGENPACATGRETCAPRDA